MQTIQTEQTAIYICETREPSAHNKHHTHLSLSLSLYMRPLRSDFVIRYYTIKKWHTQLTNYTIYYPFVGRVGGKKFYTRNNTFNSLLLFFLRVHWTHPTHLTLRWSSWLPHRSTKTIGKSYSVCWCGHLGVFLVIKRFAYLLHSTSPSHINQRCAHRNVCANVHTQNCVCVFCVLFFSVKTKQQHSTFHIPRNDWIVVYRFVALLFVMICEFSVIVVSCV